jgi:hypothetical protein
MSSQFNNISLYIPHVFANYTKDDVSKVFEDQRIGVVSHIDFVAKMSQDGKQYNSAYIHFEGWYDNIAARNFQARVLDENTEARLVYDDPWYWLVLENKAKKFTPGQRKPCLVIDQPSVSVPNAPKLNRHHKNYTFELPNPVNLNSLFDATPQTFNWTAEYQAYITEYSRPTLEEQLWLEEQMTLEEQQFDDVEAAMEEEDNYLVTIDGRYVKILEDALQYVTEW